MKKPTQKAGGRHLDDDDRALWRHAAQTVAPLTRSKDRHHPALEREDQQARSKVEKRADAGTANTNADGKSDAMPGVAAGKKHATPKSLVTTVKTVASAPPAMALFERKKARKIRSGQIEIEARIDLHGLRQDEAHTALNRFLLRCHGRGQRWVLVITGKGRKNANADDAHTAFDMTADRNRGVLKRNVPRWLDEPELRAIVVSYTTASIGHGGEGALYVHLRKRR